MRAASALLAVAVLVPACGGGDSDEPPTIHARYSFQLTSPAFQAGGSVPSIYTCDGANVSPPLAWTGQPPTAEFALVVTDIDAPGREFIHWLVLHIPGTANGLDQGVVPREALEATNSFGRAGWDGPCPPSGNPPHRYTFVLYGLSAAPPQQLTSEANFGLIVDAIQCCVQSKGTLTATYGR
jgi:Raf kinase inhibitor-like YbhB/YbcL family protein